jgi:hypothetical protein
VGGWRHRGAWTAASAAALALVLALCAARGRSGRAFAAAPAAVEVAAPALALDAWRRAGVRGRVLVLFGRYPHANTYYADWLAGAPLNDGNFLEVAVFENVVRRIYFVVPEREWEGFSAQRRMYWPYRELPGGRGAYLHNVSGIPLVACTPSSLPRSGEPVLAYVERGVFGAAEAAGILASAGLAADLVVLHGAEGAR